MLMYFSGHKIQEPTGVKGDLLAPTTINVSWTPPKNAQPNEVCFQSIYLFICLVFTG